MNGQSEFVFDLVNAVIRLAGSGMHFRRTHYSEGVYQWYIILQLHQDNSLKLTQSDGNVKPGRKFSGTSISSRVSEMSC